LEAAGSQQTPAGETPRTDSTTADSDADGVDDSADLCPDSATGVAVEETGCVPERAVVLEGVNFRYDSHELTDPARVVLDRIAAVLGKHPQLKLEVAGHTDAQGDPAYNQWLSELRARSVRDYLVARGVNPDNISAQGYGASEPVAANDTRAGLRRNRRVELRRLQ
jgi:OOP family OmpA-OmpF porin